MMKCGTSKVTHADVAELVDVRVASGSSQGDLTNELVHLTESRGRGT